MEENADPWKNKWTEHHEIARGGQGIISEVRSNDASQSRAVLKRIVPRWKDDPQAIERLKHETETLLKLGQYQAKNSYCH